MHGSVVLRSGRFHLPNGDSIELDSNKMPGSSTDFDAPVIEALAGTAP